jgi:hypothetical protein
MSAVAENIQTQMPEPIVFTDSAAAKVADLAWMPLTRLPQESRLRAAFCCPSFSAPLFLLP